MYHTLSTVDPLSYGSDIWSNTYHHIMVRKMQVLRLLSLVSGWSIKTIMHHRALPSVPLAFSTEMIIIIIMIIGIHNSHE